MPYIDRDKLIKELSTMYKSPTSAEDFMTVGYDHAIADIVVTVHEQPTADVVDVKHGKWIWQGSISEGCWICSECNHKFYQGYGNENFCPNCGAKMDGKETKAEVVGEIVRCKDCKHSFKRDFGFGCELDYRLGTNGKWFCADGERKETDDAEIH